MMKRKRAHDEKLILQHDKKKDQPLEEINNDKDDENQTRILEVRISNVENESSK